MNSELRYKFGQSASPLEDRMPLSRREYAEIKHMFGFVDALDLARPYIEKRLRTIPGGWRDFRLLQAVSQRLLASVLNTVPLKKLAQIRADLDNLRVNITVSPNGPRGEITPEGVTHVPVDALIYLCGAVCDDRCMFCDKRGKDAKKCKLRKALMDTLPYHVPEFDGDECPMAGSGLVGVEEEYES